MCILFGNTAKMWPMYVDYSDEECRRVLRSLELEAYANVVNAFRAQGSLSKERRKMLQDLCSMLSISMERHRAEIRRAVNDEHLNTIAERLCGPNTATEWAIEGRRVVPLMPRLAPQTVFTAVADTAANAQAAKNASLPLPGRTGVREISNGIETMASRKRKELPPDVAFSPSKQIALDNQYFNNIYPFENNSCLLEPPQTQLGTANSDNVSLPEGTSTQFSSFSEQLPIKTTASILTSSTTSVAPPKPPPKQIMLKSSSTVTTYSSFDQLNTNLLSSKPASHSPVPTAIHEEQITAVTDVSKISTESKNFQRSSPSVTMKTPSIIPTPISTCSTATTSSDRLPISSTAASSIGNKFLTQIRCKSTGHARQNLSLGLKLNSQSQMSQKGLTPKSSPNLKVKQDNPPNLFTKKLSQTVFSSASDSPGGQYSLSSVTESTPATKSPISVTKSSVKTESSIVSSAQTSNKLTTVTKNFPKTSTPTSLTRSLFSTATKAGAKSLPPVIFNVSSTSCTSLQTTTKTTVSVPSDGTKTTPQLLPKSTSVGLTPSHLKINASNSPTIQYRNDGGVMRSARIVNISQPGSRLPCGISSTTISALGLASNLTSTALRVTLPAGTLNTSASMRVSAAAKPNVIVVHKAQMWPRTQGAAVIMSSNASLPKISNDESGSLAQKQEKGRLSGAKLASRPVTPAQTPSPAVSAATLKIPETSLMANPLAVKSSSSDNSVSSDNSNPKSQENVNSAENQCKKNLLADVIEASGILENDPEKVSSTGKEKNTESTEEKGQSSVLDSEAKSLKKTPPASSVVDSAASVPQEINTSKSELTKTTSEKESIPSADTEKTGVGTKLSEFPTEPKEISELASSQVHENSLNTAESSSVQIEAPKEKNS